MSEDPKLFEAGDYNLFRYCQNDPIDMTDPMGLDAHALSGHITPELLDYVTKGLGATEAYARVMGLVQNAMSSLGYGAISIGSVGYQLSKAMGTPSFHIAQMTKGNSEPSKARQLGMQAVQKAEGDLKETGQYFGYSIYDVDGKLKWFKSDPGYWDGKRWIEPYRIPRSIPDDAFVANGHLHPRPDHEHPYLGTSWSGYDKALGGRGPVLKRDYERSGYYDEYFKGTRSLVRPDGVTETTY
jgi:hypothetical protein